MDFKGGHKEMLQGLRKTKEIFFRAVKVNHIYTIQKSGVSKFLEKPKFLENSILE